jgi:hypothetical protein
MRERDPAGARVAIGGKRHGPHRPAHESREAFLADPRMDLVLAEIHNTTSMSDEAPKSAYELAMERLRRKDAETGAAPTALTEGQKAEIAEVRRVYEAKAAEAEILHRSRMMRTFDPAERLKLDEEYHRDLQRLQDERERKIAKIRGE